MIKEIEDTENFIISEEGKIFREKRIKLKSNCNTVVSNILTIKTDLNKVDTMYKIRNQNNIKEFI